MTNTIIGNEKINSYYNYFIGKDSTKWKSRVPLQQIKISLMYIKI